MQLRKCPCGQRPLSLIVEVGSTSKWGYAYGHCCSEWIIEFRTVNHDALSDASYENAVKAWNDSPRAKDGDFQ